jgi:hypothetical protein
MKRLLSMLKVIPDNVRVLHRNLVGAGWFADHEELGEIYGEIDGIADDVIEIGISLGNQEPSLEEAVAEYKSIGGSVYENEDAWAILHAMLLDLHEELGNQEGKVPGDVWNKLEEHQYYLNKLANYKVASRLNKRAIESIPELPPGAAEIPAEEAYSTEELQEAFTKAGLDTKKYTTGYLAEQLGFEPLNELRDETVRRAKQKSDEVAELAKKWASTTPEWKNWIEFMDKPYEERLKNPKMADFVQREVAGNSEYLDYLNKRRRANRISDLALLNYDIRESYTAAELREAFTKAGLDTKKYTTEYLAEQLGFVENVSNDKFNSWVKRYPKDQPGVASEIASNDARPEVNNELLRDVRGSVKGKGGKNISSPI